MATEAGACEVYRQKDGWWRWRWVPDDEGGAALFSAHTFESESEAVKSAAAAFPDAPGKPPELVAERSRGAPRKRRFRLLIVAAVLAGLLARRMINPSRTRHR